MVNYDSHTFRKTNPVIEFKKDEDQFHFLQPKLNS